MKCNVGAITLLDTMRHLQSITSTPACSPDADVRALGQPLSAPLLEVSGLTTRFSTRHGEVIAVNGVDMAITQGESLALVGESGSGKSMLARSLMGLVPEPGRITSGTIMFEGVDLLRLNEPGMRAIRGNRMAMIFQEPMTSLNPVLRIGDQITEPLLIHRALGRSDAEAQGIELLQRVGIPSAQERMRDYPHQLSGGMRQRVMIAAALACSPSLLIADEPTTALDVTIQAQILELISTLRTSNRMGLLLITHDFGVVAERTDRTCVMYAGRIIETAPTRELLRNPLHPYTQALLASLPSVGTPGTPLATIPGQPSGRETTYQGCGFCDRCPVALPRCRTELPDNREYSPGHTARCWKIA